MFTIQIHIVLPSGLSNEFVVFLDRCLRIWPTAAKNATRRRSKLLDRHSKAKRPILKSSHSEPTKRFNRRYRLTFFKMRNRCLLRFQLQNFTASTTNRALNRSPMRFLLLIFKMAHKSRLKHLRLHFQQLNSRTKKQCNQTKRLLLRFQPPLSKSRLSNRSRLRFQHHTSKNLLPRRFHRPFLQRQVLTRPRDRRFQKRCRLQLRFKRHSIRMKN